MRISQRVQSKAGAGEVLVTRTLVDLVVGSVPHFVGPRLRGRVVRLK
jgi:hypothetical protein